MTTPQQSFSRSLRRSPPHSSKSEAEPPARLALPALGVLLCLLTSALSACGGGGAPVALGTGGTVAGTGGAVATGGGTATGGAATNTGGTGTADGATLQAVYEPYFPIGAAIAQVHLDTVESILVTHFNRITAENAMKFGGVSTGEGTYDWSKADSLADFARTHDMDMTGHTLVWHRQAPSWLFSDLTAGNADDIETLKGRMKAHIDTIVPRYDDVVDNWDVVNEAISDDASKKFRDGAEGSDFYRIFGNEKYVYWAFKYAHDALEAIEPGNAEGKLYYNDYNVTLKVDRIIALCDWVQEQGVPVHGIGLQQHVTVDWPGIAEIEETINKITAAGYAVKISELDMSVYNDYQDGKLDPEPETEFTAALEAEQAQRYGDLFALYRRHADDITSVTFWGVSDAHTWLDNEPVPGRADYPLLWDENHQPKQALDSVLDF